MKNKIVVIEDNPTNLELMIYLLEYFNYRVLTATNGEDGLALVEKELPDLIICDIQLPKLDGYQIAERLKCNTKCKHIPLIAVTAFSMVGDRDKLLECGFDGYISKPINPEKFVNEIKNYLSSKGQVEKI